MAKRKDDTGTRDLDRDDPTQNSGEFNVPDVPEEPTPTTGEDRPVDSFDPPPGSAEDYLEEFDGTVSDAMLETLATVDTYLASAVAQADAIYASSGSLSDPNGIVGVGIGFLEDPSGKNAPGVPVLNLYVETPVDVEMAQSLLAQACGVSALALNETPVQVIVTGPIDAFATPRDRLRPAPCGVSAGHIRITAGTLGALGTGRSAPRNRRLLALSNNHVFANSNGGKIGDAIVQPGPADGGRLPGDVIGILEKFVPINFTGGANTVDCATAWCWPARVRKDFVYFPQGTATLFNVSSKPVAASVGMIVGKTGRTTGLTQGRVTDIRATLRVNFGAGRVALFRDQLAIRSTNSNAFSAGGDSGSLIWTWNAARNPVGLLFAGGGGITFANKIQAVLAALDINLVT